MPTACWERGEFAVDAADAADAALIEASLRRMRRRAVRVAVVTHGELLSANRPIVGEIVVVSNTTVGESPGGRRNSGGLQH